MTQPTAELSPCGLYRYRLSRPLPATLAPTGPAVFVMLNPSTADATQDDPTVRRCRGFAERMGATELVIVNLYAYRTLSPRALEAARAAGVDVVGPANDETIAAAARFAVSAGGTVVAAWGAHPLAELRAGHVADLLTAHGATMLALEVTATGAPRHPLYLRADLEPTPWPR